MQWIKIGNRVLNMGLVTGIIRSQGYCTLHFQGTERYEQINKEDLAEFFTLLSRQNIPVPNEPPPMTGKVTVIGGAGDD